MDVCVYIYDNVRLELVSEQNGFSHLQNSLIAYVSSARGKTL